MRKLFFFLLIIVSKLILAQTDTIQGYIITNDSDTVHGFFKKFDEKTNSKYCEFIAEKSIEPKKYLPGQILGYRFTNRNFYVTRTIEINKERKEVFAEFLLKGEINLYYYGGSNTSTYFIENEKGKLVYLEGGEKTVTKNNSTSKMDYIVDNTKYKGILNYLFNDYPNAYKEISNTELKHKDLIKLSENYHNYKCSDSECIIFVKEKNEGRFIYSLGGYAGSYLGDYTFYETIDYTNYLNISGYSFGIEANVFSKKSMARFFTTMRAGISIGEKAKDQLSYSETNINLSVSFNAKILKSNLSPYIGIGYQHLSSKVKRTNFQYFESSVFRETKDSFSKKVFSSIATAGLFYKIDKKTIIRAEYTIMLPYDLLLYSEGLSKKSDYKNVVTSSSQQCIIVSANIIIGKL